MRCIIQKQREERNDIVGSSSFAESIIEPEVWEFQIGGYQVCAKWLKDRTIRKLGRPLSYDDITHYQSVVLALREPRQLMEEIDQIVPAWPIE